MISLTEANNYFAVHLDAEFWTALSDAEKNNALTTAESEITILLGLEEMDEEEQSHIGAVCEQAVFLARHHEHVNLPEDVASENISSAGSRSYRRRGVMGMIAPRARLFIRKITGGDSFSRG